MPEIEYPEEFDRLLDAAADRMEERDYATAAGLLEQAADLVPEDPEVWQRLGATRFSLSDDAGAEQAYRRWWELTPGNALAYRAYANLLFRMARYPEAEAATLLWLAREPNDPYGLVLLANAKYKMGQEFDAWLERAQSIDPDAFEQMMTGVFDFSTGSEPGEWGSLDAAEYLGLPETRVVEMAAAGGLPRHYRAETETFSFRKADLDRRREVLERYGLEPVPDRAREPLVEIDYATDIDDLGAATEVRVLLQKCPHCGEWTAGPLGDRERYFCCGQPMDPFVELSSEIEVQGRVLRTAGGGRELSDRIGRLSPDQLAELRELWLNHEPWLPRAERMEREDEGPRGSRGPVPD